MRPLAVPAGRGANSGTTWTGAVPRLIPAAVALLPVYVLPWIAVAPNRLLPGRGVRAVEALGPLAHLPAALVVVAIALGIGRGQQGRARFWTAAALTAAVALLPILTGFGAAELLHGRPPAARATLGAGFWLALVGTSVLLAAEARRTGRRGATPLVFGVVLATLAAAAASGALDHLSLVVEYRARADLLGAALATHLGLAAAALALALAVAVPLSWAAFRRPQTEAAAFAVLQGIQVVPAIALLAGLVPLLALLLTAFPALRGLGLGAVGPAPAVIGTAAYLALPLVSSFVAALRTADPALVEAALGMGMTEARIAREVRIPLGLPVLVAGLRVGAVQSVGLATLGGLVGAGGLGAVVFDGMAQFAPDLILLGAAPVVVLGVVADLGLRTAERRLGRRS